MLKRLELWGFKSFADKTVFEFGRGITAIVGPNGSGKSNVVDAIRWVLGEQSAKSLRGKEMADCIFHGSGSRRGVGFAEVTVVIDNTRRYLRFDGDEVAITRRVYRSGESEYYINRKPARLRDIRELLVGTGTSSQTYSIIEQGRVDALLQASPRERRLIFEEASGIRAFKLKKQEALNKLEKVEQNLTRVNDILEEVQRRLKTVRAQATKAQRYRELSKALQELRVKLGLVDYRRLEAAARELESELARLQESLEDLSVQLDVHGAEEAEIEQQLDSLDNTIRSDEGELSNVRQEIARLESSLRHERARQRELEQALEETRYRWRDSIRRCRELEQRLSELEQRYGEENERISRQEAELRRAEAQLAELLQQVARLDQQATQHEADLLDLTQELSRARNEIAAIESQIRTLEAQRERYHLRQQQLQDDAERIDDDVARLRRRLQELWSTRDDTLGQLRAIETEQSFVESELERLRARRSDLAAQLRGCESKLEVYRNLERERSGVPAGARELVDRAELRPHVVGLLADLIEADVDAARLIDRALGPLAHAVVVRSLSAVLAAERPTHPVTLLDLSAPPPELLPPHPGTTRLSELVRCSEELRPLIDRLLGNTFVMDSLPVGEQAVRKGERWISRAGDLIDCQGIAVLGGTEAEPGLVSRKALMRELEAELHRLQAEMAECDDLLARATERLRDLARRRQETQAELDKINELVSAQEHELTQREQQLRGVREELELLAGEIDLLDSEVKRLTENLEQKQRELEEHIQREQTLRASLEEIRKAREALSATREEQAAQINERKVELAREKERVLSLTRELEAVRDDLQDRTRVKEQALEEMLRIERQLQVCRRSILEASSQLAQLYDRKDTLSRRVGRLIADRETLRQQKQKISATVAQLRQQREELQAKLSTLQLQQQELIHRRDNLIEKLQEDYEIDLRALAREQTVEEDFDYESAAEEAKRLKKRIQALGSVNLEALRELEELEERERTLTEQRNDLLAAKESLLEIIERINEDSKRLFLQTLNTIRGHFQELFRKLFGGGKADIVLEDPDDVLESGVEIIAKPPGKELKSISLLSGGEKTLTAVALLLAIFRSKPSPFCVLDEVDAALDEANIDRFTAVLREFLDRSQFILITHSKKTMLAADVLYGITMQESGVSKRISVRLEDINEAGEIRPEALEREGAEDDRDAA